MIPEEAIEAAADAISESSGMRFDGFWSRIEDLEPEDREYALAEARTALEAAAPFIRAQAMEDTTVIHVHSHHDIEAHARIYNEGYDAAVTQGLADDPSLADDWFQGKIREARADALQEAANAIEALRPEMGPGINITQYREGRNDAFVRAADVCTARAVAERGGE